MNFLSLNIKWLKEKEGLSEVDFGKLFGLKRGAISSYIHDGIIPKIETLQKISAKYSLTLDDLFYTDISVRKEKTLIQYPNQESVSPSSESITFYTCPECISKQKEIDILKRENHCLEMANSALNELLDKYRNDAKKETESKNSVQEGQVAKL